MLVNTSYASGHRGDLGFNPLWIPVAIISTLAAISIAQPQPVVYERSDRYEPRQQVIIREEPRYYRHAHYYDADRAYEAPRYRDYR
jgi:hypothetical protein